ncbi:hypothetical protein [Streptomyces sp. NPDC017993]|uniref:hypothetical protein n=1 Tax=Streptomyces sp. NPDC017993 TaxID=3365027 RepID=UPI00379B3570
MRRAISMATSVAIAVSAGAIGYLLVLVRTPPDGGAPTGGPSAVTAPLPGQPGAPGPTKGSAARAVTTGLGAPPPHTGVPSPLPAAAPQAGRIEVTAPPRGLTFRVNGSFTVSWKNTTGENVNVWLHTKSGKSRPERLVMVAPRGGNKPTDEAIVTLPRVPAGPSYRLEVAAAYGPATAFSNTFAITG